ncbi:MAG: Smr/MutS family protein [Methylobacterium mesophilicum]|nr:Smr/MutS family protein [Methylobacterium mesophilicum]
MTAAPLISDEDRVLWNLVAKTVRPLRPATRVIETDLPSMAELLGETPKPAAPQPTPPVRKPPAPVMLDKPTHAKIAKGRLAIEARVDLHGLYQYQAYTLLLGFLRSAHARGARHVLVITGKGQGGDGVLRRSVPDWLMTGPFREVVSGFDHAARGHGGTGALYVRVKRRA